MSQIIAEILRSVRKFFFCLKPLLKIEVTPTWGFFLSPKQAKVVDKLWSTFLIDNQISDFFFSIKI